MTRIPWAVWRPAPPWKRGYSGVNWNSLDWKEGEVKHSAEGSLEAMFAVLDRERQASWHFSLPKTGPVRVYQHYELEDICWHCGVPGDLRHDTSLIGNITLIGEEHEGRLAEPLTAWQEENTILLSRELRARCPAIGRKPPALRANLWEHNWLSPTRLPQRPYSLGEDHSGYSRCATTTKGGGNDPRRSNCDRADRRPHNALDGASRGRRRGAGAESGQPVRRGRGR